jgi:hypothetical protein
MLEALTGQAKYELISLIDQEAGEIEKIKKEKTSSNFPAIKWMT